MLPCTEVWLKLFDGCDALNAAELKLNSALLDKIIKPLKIESHRVVVAGGC